MEGLWEQVRTVLRRAAAGLRRNRLDDDLRGEIELHIALRRAALEDEGAEPREAEYEARRIFGNVAAIREGARDMWGFPAIDALLQDLRNGARMLRRAPLFAATAVLSLAAGIGSSVAVFSVADAVIFRPLPVKEPAALSELRFHARLGGASKTGTSVPLPALGELQRGTDFAELTGFQNSGPAVIAGLAAGAGRQARLELVTGNYFSILGVGAAAGRLIGPEDVRTGGDPVAVLSFRLWSALFNRDEAILGRTITVAGSPVRVVGIAAAGFGGLMIDRPAEIFLPITLARLVETLPAGTDPSVRVIARLPRNLDPVVAAERLTATYAPLAALAFTAPAPRVDVLLQPASHGLSESRPQMERPLAVVLGLVGVLLLISCANVGNLLLSRFASRQDEFAVRLAIGATLRRAVQHLVVESLLVAGLAAAAGLVLARTLAPLLVRLIPTPGEPLDLALPLDSRLIAFTVATAAAAGLLSAAASAARLGRLHASGALRADTRTLARGRGVFARILIVAQVASSLLLVVGAASMLRTVHNLWEIDPGFEADGAFLLSANATHITESRRLPVYLDGLRVRLSAAPGVAFASVAQLPLMGTGRTSGTVDTPGFTPSSDEDRWCRVFQVGPDFFATAGMRLLRGRPLDQSDTAASEPVAVINQSFARFYFGAADPIGRVVNRNIRIVGIVADTRHDSLREPPDRTIFQPYQQVRSRSRMTYIVRSAPGAAPTNVIASAREVARAYDPALRIEIITLNDQVAKSVARERFLATLMTAFSAVALILACTGLYAVLAYSVSERRSEIGIRIALGARPRDIVALVLRQPVAVTAAGIAVGLPGAYLVMRTLDSLLFGIPSFDAWTIGVPTAVLFGVALAAGLLPAWRAASIDPRRSLRCS